MRNHALKGRLAILAVGLLIWTAALCLRLYQVQVAQAEGYRSQAVNQRKGFIDIPARRGDILDRNGAPLAASVSMASLYAHPEQVEDPAAAAQALAQLLPGVSAGRLEQRLKSSSPFVYLARRVAPALARQALDLELEGIGMRSEPRRLYPDRELAAHLVGFVGDDGKGLSGLEYRYDEHLQGSRARIDVRVDARRRSYSMESGRTRTQGRTLMLHIDKELQYIAGQVLRETVHASGASGGSVVLMEPDSGAVLAMASYPEFNPNRFTQYDRESFRNRAISAVYEPGSTFKIFSLSSVLDQGLVTPGEEIDCRVGTLRLGRKVYREAEHSYGILDFDGIVAKSSNVGTIKLVLRLGEEGFHDYIRRFGFGSKTGVDLPAEEAGILRPPKRWSKLSIGSLSIGQEIGATPLQIAAAMSAVANGGTLIEPRLVAKVLEPDGGQVALDAPSRRRVLSEATIRRMKQALEAVVEKGTGKEARLNGYSSAGKTGTAQKIVNGRYSKSLYIPSYAGFAPVEDPALAAVLVIEEPRGGRYYASDVVVPAWRQIVERSLIYLKVAKDRPHETAPPLPALTRRKTEQFPAGGHSNEGEPKIAASLKTSGEGSDVSSRREDAPVVEHIVAASGEALQLPDFTGMSLREALGWSNRLGIRLHPIGAGAAVVGQSPSPGSRIGPGMRCQVYFSKKDERANAAGRTDLKSAGEDRP